MTDKTKRQLRECPFCGGEAKITQANHEAWVSCENYHYTRHQVSVHAKGAAEAIEAWNTRAERTCHVTRETRTLHSVFHGDAEVVDERCSECGGYIEVGCGVIRNYCPNCGAKVVEA